MSSSSGGRLGTGEERGAAATRCRRRGRRAMPDWGGRAEALDWGGLGATGGYVAAVRVLEG
jgi:hypothetical protein